MSTTQKIVGLLGRLQDRLTKIGKKTHENTEQISLVRDTAESAFNGLAKHVEEFRVQSFQRDEKLGTAVAELRTGLGIVQDTANDREAKQTLRDQNNVASLTALRDSTARAFDQVKKDVQELINRNDRTNYRVGKTEAFQEDLLERAKKAVINAAQIQASPALPVGHEWVNKKLSGVYDVADDFEARLRKLEVAPVVSTQVPVVSQNRARVVNKEGYCTDVVCRNQSVIQHYFGPGCRFYESGW